MARITINDVEVEADAGRRLVEVIKEAGVRITNLCYIDGLEPYAGCRTCIVDIAGARPTTLQLSCTATVADGMVIRTDTPEVKQARQGVMSLIMANHPDRCLTCHRRVHCQPGEICLRDDVVTHRCLTCAKNYRCELQTSTEMIDMGEFEENWVGEERSYYETPAPEPDRANPYLEFDPQMCIICTRCVRACADVRHTGAITLAGKGSTTAIAFGTGGPVHDSDCDFCGACIDVCPTATLMEKPNKWVGLAEDWTNSVCNGCAVGCTISYGTAGGVPVIVRPDRLNAFSRDQICVRGRFGYDAITERERLTRSLARRGERLLPVSFDEALAEAAAAIDLVRGEHGAGAIAVLGSPLATNEEAALLTRLAREVIGTPHLDFSQGPLHRAVVGAFRDAFGSEQLPASLTDIETADTIVVIAGDLEESHQIAALRVKDAVVKRSARLVVVSPRWGELVPFATAWLQPAPGGEAAAVQALAQAVAADAAVFGDPIEGGVTTESLATAVGALGAARDNAAGSVAIVYAPDPIGVASAGDTARGAANLAIALRAEAAAGVLHYLPTDANVVGITDMGLTPGPEGRGFAEIIEGARSGAVKALIIHADNPLLNAPATAEVRAALEALDALVVIDSVRSTASEHAQVVLAALPFFATDGTITTADHRLVRQRSTGSTYRDARAGIDVIASLVLALGGAVSEQSAADVMAQVATRVPGYVAYGALQSGRTRALVPEPTVRTARVQPVVARTAAAPAAPRGRRRATSPAPEAEGGLKLTVGRSLFTSWDGASIRSEEADKLHREEAAVLHPRDAEAAGVRAGDTIVLTDGLTEVRITARLDSGMALGAVYVPQYYDGGAVLALLPPEGATATVATVRVRALQPA